MLRLAPGGLCVHCRPGSVGNDVRGRADARISYCAEWVQACGGGSQSQRSCPAASEGRVGHVRMGKTNMKSLISSHCRRHCLSLMLRLPILFGSRLVFMNISLGHLLGLHQHQRMDRGKQAGIDDDGETSIHVGNVCTCVF
jgi:hypothetical protein